ncbi:hypothetical protein HGM15179_008090 [Zosterops borbonicus]|uniref:Uncharacterized protein n=1 Tax=Zosterops borbonicus TaxID=364589 RepID=A0A8K1GJL6_9PASS|nr:hypothetical protein HGM15179_008090 [Zosterops borbonicus]
MHRQERAGHPNMNPLTKGITSSFQSKTSYLTRNNKFTPDLLLSLQPQSHKPTREAKKTPPRQWESRRGSQLEPFGITVLLQQCLERGAGRSLQG